MVEVNKDKMGSVYWITGLSGAGKTTQCKLLTNYLRKKGSSVVMLDGDVLRDIMGASEKHLREDRLVLALSYSKMCKMISDQGVDVCIATISMFHEVHKWNRSNIKNYFEIFLDVPLDELRKRDKKMIYKKQDTKEGRNVVGIDLRVEFPEKPDKKVIWKKGLDVDAIFSQILSYLKLKNNQKPIT